MNRTLRATLLGFAAFACSFASARADATIYVFTGTGSGTFDGVSFTNQAFTFTAFVADPTATSPAFGGYFLSVTSATVSEGGVQDVISTPLALTAGGDNGGFVYLNNNSVSQPNNPLLGITKNSTFSTYNFQTALPPTSSSGDVDVNNTSSTIVTSGGSFVFTPTNNVGGLSFAATTVPEPTSLVLLGTSIAGFGLIALRRRRANA